MFVKHIFYDDDFSKDFFDLQKHIQQQAIKSEKLFRENPLHSSLRLHQLQGSLDSLWSISVTRKIRIIFERNDSGDIIFLSTGHHDIYKNL